MSIIFKITFLYIFLLPLIIFTTVNPASSQFKEIKIISKKVKAGPNQYYVSAKNCQELKEVFAAILAWSQKKSEFICEKIPESSEYQAEITSILPTKINSHLLADRCTVMDGANCWNTALNFVFPSLDYHFRFTHEDEFNFLINSPEFCIKRSPGEQPQPGDIAVIRDSIHPPSDPDCEVHAFTYLTPSLSFSKDGPEKDLPYKFLKTNTIFKKFGIEDAQCIGIDFSNEKKITCPYYAAYYRCTIPKLEIEGFKKILTELLKIGQLYEELLFNSKSSRQLFEILSELQKLNSNNLISSCDKKNSSQEPKKAIIREIKTKLDILMKKSGEVVIDSDTGIRERILIETRIKSLKMHLIYLEDHYGILE